jgi:hypothetical protein
MNPFITTAIKQLEYYKSLADKTFQQLTDEQLFWQYNAESLSIAMIVQHLSGNMLSRWTDFLTTDGEKDWRNREAEFEAHLTSRTAVLIAWEKGWQCLFDAINPLTETELLQIIYIRNEGHTVLEAINRQLAHYPYHIGQITYIGKMLLDAQWQSLSIPKGNSKAYNANKFTKEKTIKHFIDGMKEA